MKNIKVDFENRSLIVQNGEAEVSWNEISVSLFSLLKPEMKDPQEVNIINWGISHFLQNVSRPNNGRITLDDYNLFMKYFGPQNHC